MLTVYELAELIGQLSEEQQEALASAVYCAREEWLRNGYIALAEVQQSQGQASEHEEELSERPGETQVRSGRQ